jgi:RimK family alpha-L-glutamate ligase
VAAEAFEDALAAFRTLGGDVVVKPLFGSGGRGIFRLTDEEMAYRAFRTMEMHRWVYYLQRYVPHGTEDIRAFVVGDRVVAACNRVGLDWRSNVGRGATTRPRALSAAQEDLVLRSCRALGVEYAGVDLVEDPDGKSWVLEVNSIPGWSGLQESTSIDIASELVSHVLRRARGSRRAAAAG